MKGVLSVVPVVAALASAAAVPVLPQQPPVRIGGADYTLFLESGMYVDPSQRQFGHWVNPEMADVAFIRDAAPVVKSTRWELPPEGATWPKVSDNFSPRDNRCWNGQEANVKRDRPLVEIFAPKGFVRALAGDLDLDMDDYRAWKARHPNLVWLRMLSEWGNVLACLPRTVAALPASPEKDELLAVLSRHDMKNRYDRLALAKWYADRKIALNYGDRDLFMAMRSVVYLDHVAAAWGAKAIYSETTDSTGSDAEYRWDVSAMFARGAARQFSIPWVWYTAIYLNGFAEDGRWLTDSSCNYICPRGNQIPDGGFSQSLQRRSWYYAYLTGASGLEQENWLHMFTTTNNPERKAVLSPRGRNFAEYHDFTRRHPGRGSVFAPVAVLVPFAQGYRAMGGRAWGVCDYLPGDYAVDSVFFSIAPGFERHREMAERGREGCLRNSKFAFMYDVLCPDAPQPVEDFVRALSCYAAAIVVGEYRDTGRLHDVLAAYKSNGGRLLRVTPDMLPPLTGDPVPDIWAGRLRFPKVEEMLLGLQDEYFPFAVEGDIAFGANRIEGGWWLWCMNNRGVFKFADRPERVDAAAASAVRARPKAGIRIGGVRELVRDSAVDARDGAFEFTVPAGDLAVFEIKDRP